MATEKFLFIVFCETDRSDAEDFIKEVRDTACASMLKDIAATPVGLTNWAVGELVPVADRVTAKEAVEFLS